MDTRWVTIRNAKDIHTCSSRVPLAEVYSPISDALRTALPNEIKSSSVGMAPAPCRHEIGGFTSLPGPGNLEGRPVFEQNSGNSVDSGD